VTALLRTVRRQRGLTLEAVAEQTGLTKSYLSKVERGLNVPSISVALKISRALGVDVSQLFSDEPSGRHTAVTRAADLDGTSAGRYRAIAAGVLGKTMSPFLLVPDFDFGDYRDHTGQEFTFVHSGAIELDLDGNVELLRSGDSCYFDASVPHRIRSVTAETSKVLVVIHDVPGVDLECHPHCHD